MPAAVHHTYQPVGPWAAHAACADMTAAMEIPVRRSQTMSPAYRAHIANAKAICHGCPVQTECLEWAMTSPDPAVHMVAGGYTPDERKQRRC